MFKIYTLKKMESANPLFTSGNITRLNFSNQETLLEQFSKSLEEELSSGRVVAIKEQQDTSITLFLKTRTFLKLELVEETVLEPEDLTIAVRPDVLAQMEQLLPSFVAMYLKSHATTFAYLSLNSIEAYLAKDDFKQLPISTQLGLTLRESEVDLFAQQLRQVILAQVSNCRAESAEPQEGMSA